LLQMVNQNDYCDSEETELVISLSRRGSMWKKKIPGYLEAEAGRKKRQVKVRQARRAMDQSFTEGRQKRQIELRNTTRAGFTFGRFKAANRVPTKIPNECWGVVLEFLVGSFAVVAKAKTRMIWSTSSSPPKLKEIEVDGKFSILPELKLYASLRSVCHDLYDAVDFFNPWKKLAEKLSLDIPPIHLGKITREDWQKVFTGDTAKMKVGTLKDMTRPIIQSLVKKNRNSDDYPQRNFATCDGSQIRVGLSKIELIGQLQAIFHVDGSMVLPNSLPPSIIWRRREEKCSGIVPPRKNFFNNFMMY